MAKALSKAEFETLLVYQPFFGRLSRTAQVVCKAFVALCGRPEPGKSKEGERFYRLTLRSADLEKLADLCGCSVRTVQRGLACLVKVCRGYFTRELTGRRSVLRLMMPATKSQENRAKVDNAARERRERKRAERREAKYRRQQNRRWPKPEPQPPADQPVCPRVAAVIAARLGPVLPSLGRLPNEGYERTRVVKAARRLRAAGGA